MKAKIVAISSLIFVLAFTVGCGLIPGKREFFHAAQHTRWADQFKLFQCHFACPTVDPWHDEFTRQFGSQPGMKLLNSSHMWEAYQTLIYE